MAFKPQVIEKYKSPAQVECPSRSCGILASRCPQTALGAGTGKNIPDTRSSYPKLTFFQVPSPVMSKFPNLTSYALPYATVLGFSIMALKLW